MRVGQQRRAVQTPDGSEALESAQGRHDDRRAQTAIQRRIAAAADARPVQPVIQKKGERTAISTTKRDGVQTDHAIRRGNRRGSIDETGGLSSAKLFAPGVGFRHRVGELKQHVKNRMVESGDYTEEQANALLKSNDSFLRAEAIQLVSVGNCGEFAMVVFSHLIQNTTGQWAHRCSMAGNQPGTDSAYDHSFVLTYPKRLETVAGADKEKATIADAWDGYQIMTLRQFMEGGSAYGTQLSDDNISIKERRQATGEQVFDDTIKGYIEEWTLAFNREFDEAIEDPDSQYRQTAAEFHGSDFGFGTDGSNVRGQDRRTAEQKWANSTNQEKRTLAGQVSDALLFKHLNKLSNDDKVDFMGRLPDDRVVAYLNNCWNKGFFQRLAISSYPYKTDIISSLDAVRARAILDAMPVANKNRILRDLPAAKRNELTAPVEPV